MDSPPLPNRTRLAEAAASRTRSAVSAGQTHLALPTNPSAATTSPIHLAALSKIPLAALSKIPLAPPKQIPLVASTRQSLTADRRRQNPAVVPTGRAAAQTNRHPRWVLRKPAETRRLRAEPPKLRIRRR